MLVDPVQYLIQKKNDNLRDSIEHHTLHRPKPKKELFLCRAKQGEGEEATDRNTCSTIEWMQ